MTLVLLADDDILILNRLRNIIDWNGNGYEIAGQALNGSDALRQVEKLRPDILILDVDMPDKNGIEVVKALQNQNHATSILMLSNYDTFAFVRDAMRYGAFDYLLKHQLEPELLLQKLGELKEKKRREGLRSSHIYYFANVAKQQYLKELVQSGVTDPAEHEHMMTQKDYSSKCNILVVMQITNFIILTHFSSLNREKLIDSVINLAANIFASIDNGIITHMDHGQFVILFHFVQEASCQKIKEKTDAHMRLLLSNMRKLLNISGFYQSSDIINNITKLNEVYRKTAAILNHQPVDIKKENTAPANSLDITEEKNLMDSLISANIIRTEQLLKQIYKRYSDPGRGIWISQHILFQLLQIGRRIERSRNMNIPISDKDMLHQLMQGEKHTDTIDFLWDYYKKIMTDALFSDSGYSRHVQKAILYIRENYSSSDISLAAVSEKIHVSSAHLSRIFKKETGSSFVDYLTSYRIELARQMMKNTGTDLKEISGQVGFHSYNYFLRVFKEKTGHTPSQELNTIKAGRNN